MAIIYTYPVKTVPSLQDSIVITDEADNKKTKITGIGAIIALITGDFCTTSLSQIDPDFGPAVTADDCTQAIRFTSSDASVTITGNNVAKIIDFTAAGGGGGGCPTNYVLKPVTCEEGDCFINPKLETWVWTCDETLGALAPGYIDNLILNGTAVPHPSSDLGDSCWYIEAVTLSAAGATCETCCTPSETVYKLFPCSPGTTYYTTETLTPGVSGLIGLVVIATTPDGTKCYTISEDSGPTIAVTLGAVQEFGCETPACTVLPTFSFVDCTDPTAFVTGTIEPPYAIGKVFTFCCEGGTLDQTVKCWEYVGDIGLPVGGTFDPCVNFGAELDNCDCCFNRCNYTYTACPGAPAGFPGILTFNLGMDPTTSCDCITPQNDIVVDDGAGNFWCYNTPESLCLPADELYTILGVPDAPCDDSLYCPAVPATYTWESCDDGGPLVTVAVDPGIPVGQIDRYCCDEGEIVNYCFEYKGNIGELVGGSFPCAGPIETYPADCMCCEHPCTYQYTACPGYSGPFPPTIDVNVGFDISGCDCATPDSDIYITIGPDTWCYNTPVKVCLPGAFTPTGVAECGNGEICPTPEVDLRWKICSEGVEAWRYEDELDPIPAPFNVPGNHYIGELNTPGTCVNGDCCIEVEETISLGAAVSWSTFLGETSCDSAYNATWEDCACCVNYDVVEYTACDETCEIEGVHYPTLYVDVCLWGDSIGESWKPSNAPTFMTLNPSGEECCYQLTDQDPCIPETLISTHGFIYDDLGYGDPAWIDCTCTDIVYFQYRECGSEVWIDTDTDLDAYNGGGSWQNLAGDTCYEIQEGGAGGPAIDPAILFVTEFFGAGELLPCDCCEQILREYTICPDPVCNPLAATTLLIDVALVPGWTPISHQVVVGEETASSISCCYILEESIPTCQPPTGTIITTATDCEDVACNLL